MVLWNSKHLEIFAYPMLLEQPSLIKQFQNQYTCTSLFTRHIILEDHVSNSVQVVFFTTLKRKTNFSILGIHDHVILFTSVLLHKLYIIQESDCVIKSY